MKIKYEAGDLHIGVVQLLECLSPDDLRMVADSLACEDAIIEDVSAQLLSGWTVNGSHGYTGPDGNSTLDKAQRELGKRAGERAKKEIEGLERQLCWEKSMSEKYRDAVYELRQLWADHGNICPVEVPMFKAEHGLEYEVLRKDREQ